MKIEGFKNLISEIESIPGNFLVTYPVGRGYHNEIVKTLKETGHSVITMRPILMHSEDVTLAIKKFVDNSPADKTKVIIIDELENSTGHVISKVMRVMMEKRDTLDLIPPLTGQTFDLSDVKFIITRNPNDGILHELPKYFAVHLNVYEIE
jgi:hypothetical protein